MPATTIRFDYIGAIIAYEQGELDEAAMLELFQYLVDTGLAWALQGHYGRTAKALLDAGLIQSAPEGPDWHGALCPIDPGRS